MLQRFGMHFNPAAFSGQRALCQEFRGTHRRRDVNHVVLQGDAFVSADFLEGGAAIAGIEGGQLMAEAGVEDYYEIEMPAGSSFTATVTNTADGALWVVGECEAVGGAFTCLGYADDTFTGDPEVVSYTNTSGSAMTVYLVVDSYSSSCGTYDMVFDSTGGAVANENMSMGSVKALFR